MPVIINSGTYYRTAEVCLMVGIGKTTLYRWIRENVVNEAKYRDRKGWRLFTRDEVDKLRVEASRVQKGHIADNRTMPYLKSIRKDNGQQQMHIIGKYLSGVSMR